MVITGGNAALALAYGELEGRDATATLQTCFYANDGGANGRGLVGANHSLFAMTAFPAFKNILVAAGLLRLETNQLHFSAERSSSH